MACACKPATALQGIEGAPSVEFATPTNMGLVAAAAAGYLGSRYLSPSGVGFGVGALLGLVAGSYVGALVRSERK